MGAGCATVEHTPPHNAARPITLRVGDRIPADAYVYDSDRRKHRITDLIDPHATVVVLEILAGAAVPGTISDRGGLWCEDTYNDMPLANFVYRRYAERPAVQFIPVVVPPVYHGAYGYDRAAFMATPEGDDRFERAFARFIAATEPLLRGPGRAGVIAYPRVYYDPKNRLLLNLTRTDLAPSAAYGRRYGWEGCFKWPGDSQTYGTPTMWLLGGDGTVLRRPFFGNVYEGPPQHLRYTIRDVVKAIDARLR